MSCIHTPSPPSHELTWSVFKLWSDVHTPLTSFLCYVVSTCPSPCVVLSCLVLFWLADSPCCFVLFMFVGGEYFHDNLAPLFWVLIFHIKLCCPIGPYTPISAFYGCVILWYLRRVSRQGGSSTVVGWHSGPHIPPPPHFLAPAPPTHLYMSTIWTVLYAHVCILNFLQP